MFKKKKSDGGHGTMMDAPALDAPALDAPALVKGSFAIVVALTVLCLSIAVFATCDEGGCKDDEGGVVFAAVWMLVMAIALVVVGWLCIWKRSSAMTPRFRVGYLWGALVLYTNMALVCAIYFWSMENMQEGNGGFAILCLVLAVVYAALSYLVLSQDKAISDSDQAIMEYDDDDASDAFCANISKLWIIACGVSFLGLLVALVLTVITLFTEEGERAREEGGFWGLLVAILYMMGWMGMFYKAGSNIFEGSRSETQITIGAFCGGLLFFAALACLLAVLHSSFLGEQAAEEGTLGSMAFSIVCFILMILHGAFACGVLYHSQAILYANARDRASLPFFRMSWWSKSNNNEIV